MAKSGMVEEFRDRIQQNVATQGVKLIGETLAGKAAEYFVSLPFFELLKKSMSGIFGPIAAEWVSKGAGVVAAAGIGRPEIFVQLVITVLGKKRAEADLIVGETIDAFIVRFAEGIKDGGLDNDAAAELAIESTLKPKLGAIASGLEDEAFGILHKGIVVSHHTRTCSKMYKKTRSMGFHLTDSSSGELIEDARLMPFSAMLAEGVDLEHTTCECGGMTKEFKHLVDKPRSFFAISVMLFKGSNQDRVLLERFNKSLERLENASQAVMNPEVHPEDLRALKRKLDQPIWTADMLRMLLHTWNPSDTAPPAEVMARAMSVFRVQVPTIDRLLLGGKHVLCAVFSHDDPHGALAKSRAFTSRITEDAKKASLAVAASRKHRRANGY